jgi:hypothetical protein
MSALLSAQGQSAITGTAGANTVAAGLLADVEQFLTQFGTGLGTIGSDGSPATQATGVRHHHADGIERLLQAFDSPSDANQDAPHADGLTAGPDAMSSAMAASVAGFPFSLPFSWPSDGAARGAVAPGLDAVNPMERLINLQARMLATATAGRNLSITA